MPYLVGYVTPQDYGATGNGVTDDTSAVQAAITAVSTAGGGVLLFPEGTYLCSSALTLASFVTLMGMGPGVSVIHQTTTTANGLTGTDLNNVTISGLTVTGPGSGSGIGVNLAVSVNTTVPYVIIENVRVASFGSHGLELQSVIVSRFSRVNAQGNGGDGWHLYGSPTGCHWNTCYSLSNSSGIGYHLIALTYSSLSACAADSNADGYSLSGCTSVALTGCGTEANTTDGYILSGGSGNSLTSCFIYENNHYGVHVTGSEVNAVVTGFVEHSPTGSAVNCIITDSGTSAMIINENAVTADSYASGTATLINTASSTASFPMEAAFTNATSAFKYPGNIVSQPTASTNTILSSNVAGTSSFDNFRITGAGTLAMGPGTTNRDVQVARTAIGNLSITNPLTSHGAVEIVDGNVVIGGTAALGDNGIGEIQFTNAPTPPTTNPTGGTALYASGGNMYYRNPSGFIIDLSENATTSTSTTTITGVTTIQTLASGSTVAASALQAGQIYRFAAWGSMSTAADTNTFTFGLYWGGTGGTLLSTWGASNPNSSATVSGAAWYANFDIVANTATSLAVQAVLGMNYYYGSQTQGTTTVANSASEQLVLAVTPSAIGSTITCGGFYCIRIH